MSDASVRTARAADVPAVARIQAAVWRQAYASLLDAAVLATFRPEAFATAWESSLADPPSPLHRLLVATEGEQIVGFAAIGPSGDRDQGGPAAARTATPTDEDAPTRAAEGEILALGVDPGHRTAGHGSRLLNAAVDTLRAGDFGSVAAWLLADDEPARAFAAAAGLRPDGAFRDRVVAADGRTAREVRVVAAIGDDRAP